MVYARSSELALTGGRRSHQLRQAGFERAKQELTGKLRFALLFALWHVSRMRNRLFVILFPALMAMLPLHLLAVPLILAQPTGKSTFPGDATATFEVLASGSPAPSYQWQVKTAGTGGAVSLTNGTSYGGTTTSSLTVNNPVAGMSGNTYQCVVTSGSTVTSVAAPLNCYPVPSLTPVFTLAPNTLAANSTADISLQLTGLSNSGGTADTVCIRRVLDLNGNGTADIGEPLVQSFLVTDGQVTSYGGFRNPLIPGDDDLTRNGIITTRIALPTTEVGRSAGSYLIQVSSTGGQFTPLNRTLTVTQPNYGQSISGQLTTSAVPLAFAVVAAFDLANDGNYVASAGSDAAGNYTLNLPPGNHMLIGMHAGYLASLATASPVALAPSQTLTGQEVTLTAATCTIAGRVRDNTGTKPLAGVRLYSETQNNNGPPNEIAISHSDADGNFVIASTAGQWNIGAASDALALLGYLPPDNDPTVTATAGTSTALDLSYTAATALVYGTVRDSNGTAVPGVHLNADDNPTDLYWAEAKTDADGNYYLGVSGTASWWWIELDYNSALAGYVPPTGQNITPASNSATQINFTVQQVTAHLQGTVTHNGAPLAGVFMVARPQSGNVDITVQTQADGGFDLGVTAGTWNLALADDDTRAGNLASPVIQHTIADNQTIAGIDYQVHDATGTLSGRVRDASNNPIANTWVYAHATIDSTAYDIGTDTDASGNFSLPVINGSWTVGVYHNSIHFTQQTVAVSGSAVVDFTSSGIDARLQGTVTQNGAPRAGVTIGAAGNNSWIPAVTDAAGHFDIGLPGGGTWHLRLDSGYADANFLVGPNLTEIVVNNQTITNISYPVVGATALISGTVRDSGGLPMTTSVSATATLFGVEYFAFALTDPTGFYLLPVINGSWTVNVALAGYSPRLALITGLDFSPSSPFQQWQQSYFSLPQSTDPDISGASAMVLSGAGFSNVLAYALGLDPRTAKTADLPALARASNSGSDYLALHFTRNHAATDLTYSVQASGNLLQWETLSSYSNGAWSQPGVVSESGSAPNLHVQVRDSLPIPSSPRRFLRLQVSQ